MDIIAATVSSMVAELEVDAALTCVISWPYNPWTGGVAGHCVHHVRTLKSCFVSCSCAVTTDCIPACCTGVGPVRGATNATCS